MKVFSYVLRIDSGFAPNPYWGFCTLATCKPDIRQLADEGDWVVGLGSKTGFRYGVSAEPNRLVYAMMVDEKVCFKTYSMDERFKPKIPNFGLVNEKGDNIYLYLNNRWYVRPSLHYDVEKGQYRDLVTGHFKVLVSRNFYYFGKQAPKLPPYLNNILPVTNFEVRRYKRIADNRTIEAFLEWLRKYENIRGKSPRSTEREPHALRKDRRRRADESQTYLKKEDFKKTLKKVNLM
ncbi:MAG: hypothetical protein ACTSV7_04850 [Candidatus Baldrarchaeia archaeon]